MKKLINNPANYVDEVLDGMVAAESGTYARCPASDRVIQRAIKAKDKVGLVTGGGFGHLPVFTGYVGEGLLDACAIGEVFASPRADQMLEAIKSANSGRGVLSIFGNYGGDIMNFDMAGEFADAEGIETAQVIVADDVASAEKAEASKRRGVAGMVYVFKIAGAAADEGLDLQGVKAVAQKAADSCRTVGVALSSCTIPQAGKPTFEIDDDEIELGMGIHGEPGVWRGKLIPVDEIVTELVERILADRPADAGKRVSLMVNGLGATPIEELYIMFRKAKTLLEDSGIMIVAPRVGNYATSMEMAGASLTVLDLDDDLERLLTAPTKCPFWKD